MVISSRIEIVRLPAPSVSSRRDFAGDYPNKWRRRSEAFRDRPHARAAEQHDEGAAFHSITPPARASSFEGSVEAITPKAPESSMACLSRPRMSQWP